MKKKHNLKPGVYTDRIVLSNGRTAYLEEDGPPTPLELETAQLRAAELGHDVSDFKKNGDVVIGKCRRCSVSAVIIHEELRPHGRMSGTAITYRCTEQQ